MNRQYIEQGPDLEKIEYLSRFNRTTTVIINSLTTILGTGSFYVTNGASLYYRLSVIGIERVPTDLDIVAPEFDLQQIQAELKILGVDTDYDPSPVSKWGLHYCEPQLRGVVNGIPFDLVAKSTIVKPDGDVLVQHVESCSPDWVEHLGLTIPVAPLATVQEAKLFQGRPHPKQDISDLQHIQLLLSQ